MEHQPPTRDIKSKRSIRPERSSHKSLIIDTSNNSKSHRKKNQGTAVELNNPVSREDSIGDESSSAYSQQINGDLGSPTMYKYKEAMIDKHFPPEAQGMAKIFRNKTKAERILLRLPSISNFVEQKPNNLEKEELREALIFSFYKLMRKHLKNASYRFFLSNKHQFSDALQRFSRSGNYIELVSEVDTRYKLESMVISGD